MDDASRKPPVPRTLMDDLSFLQREIEAVKREKEELFSALHAQSAFVEELERIRRSKSWRWTACMRWLCSLYRKGVYGLLAHLKKLWIEMGSPCPRLVRAVRHGMLGKLWPPR